VVAEQLSPRPRTTAERRRARALLAFACLLLWIFAHETFTRSREGRDFSIFRLDRPDAVAFPDSDARQDFMDGLAILSGDGWVNWRSTSRWSVYKPGWGALLASLAWVSCRDPAAMQFMLSWLFAMSGVAFYLALLAFFPTPRMRLLALGPTIAFVLCPPGASWWFQNTMTTEGPMLLLSLLICALAAYACSRREWRAGEGLALGMLMGAAILVRTQSRFACLAAMVPIVVANRGHVTGRALFLACLASGLLSVVGPPYLTTSYQLGRPYLGTSYQSLVAVLAWTEAGKASGGESLDPTEARSEAQAISVLSERARLAVRRNWRRPGPALKVAVRKYLRFSYANVGGILPPGRGRRLLMLAAVALSAAGLVRSLAAVGAVATIPIFYSIAYLLPNFAFSFYWDRFGVPVCWVGPLYAAGGLLWLAAGRDPLTRAADSQEVPAEPARTRQHRAWPLVAVPLWLAGCTGTLLAFNRASLPIPSSAGRVDDAMVGNRGLVRGVAFLPLLVQPGDAPVAMSDGTVEPHAETYTTFLLAVPWKLEERFQLYRFSVRGALYEGFRNGDWVWVVPAGDPREPYVRAVSPAR